MTAGRRLSGRLLAVKAALWAVGLTALLVRHTYRATFGSSVVAAVITVTGLQHR